MDRELGILFEYEDHARFYPLRILTSHEVVNDEINGFPYVVTYCPLCNTGIAFDRRHDGRVLDFGTTGMLRHSDMVMYDRQTESWWQQASGEAIVGHYAGDSLRWLPSQMISFRQFRRAYPQGVVLSRPEDGRRPYGRNPYRRYDTRDGPLGSFFQAEVDGRLRPMDRVVTVRTGDETVAYPVHRLEAVGVVNDEVGGTPIVVVWTPGTASALDADAIAAGRDVGAAGVFRRVLDGAVLRFEAGADGFTDTDTGSVWDVTGRAVAGPLEGRRLEPVVHGNYLWFAWGAFAPDTRIWR